jgi:iron complex outermembrane receptor protein
MKQLSNCGVKMKIRLALSLFILSIIPAAHAEDRLGTIVVSAARTEQSEISTPASISIISRKEIEASGADNISEVLRARGGITVKDLFGDGTRSSIAMRGFGETGGANTLVMVNGRRLNNVDLSDPALNSIALKDVERIEIIQGSAGTLYGDQAVGGVINVITRQPRDFTARVQGGVGSYNRRQLQGQVADTLNNGLNYLFSAEAKQSDGYREHNALEASNVFGTLGYEYRTGRVTVNYQNVYEDLQTPGALTADEASQDPTQSLPIFSEDYTKTREDVYGLGLRQDIGSHWQFEGEATYRDEQRDIRQSSRFFQATQTWRTERKQSEFTPRFVGFYNNPFGEMQFTAGYDYIDTDYSSELTNITDRQKVDALYVQGVIPVYRKLSLTLGGRGSRVSNDVEAPYKNGKSEDSVSVATLGLQYRPNYAWRIFGRRDENFRFPKVDEFTYTSPGNELETQTGISYEFGTEWSIPGYQAKIVLYRLELENEIAFDPSAPPPTGALFPGANVNFDPTTHKGLILQANHRLSERMRVAADYTYNNATFDSGIYAGNSISAVPREVFKFMIDYDFFPDWHWFIEANYTGKQYLAGDNGNEQGWQPGYTVLNSTLDYRIRGFKITGRINNLLNKEYAEVKTVYGAVYPMPDRNYWLYASYDF